MEEKKEIEVKDTGIDNDILKQLTEEDVLKTIENQELLNRAILNCFAECLAELKKVAKTLDQFNQTVAICGQEKLIDYFGRLNENVKAEEKRLATQEKIHQDHKKSNKKK